MSALDHNWATTVIIPVKNGGKVLDECLEAVFSQKSPFPFEVLCIDSGSTDDSVETIKRHGARLHTIPPSEFGHGRTRNLGVSLAQTPFVALITQDAIPADAHWLEELIRPFRYDEHLAGVFGRHLPHHDCRPTERFMLERHFAEFGSDNQTWRVGINPKTWREFEARRGFYTFFSDNNAALRKSVWEKIPYPDVEFMEDQLWATAVLEAGFGKAWAPRSCVRHSHNYDVPTTFKRAFDESRFRRLYQDPPRPWPLSKWLEHARVVSGRDLRRLSFEQKAPLKEKALLVARHHADSLGRFLGDAAPLLPRPVVQTLSQHVALRGVEESTQQAGLLREVQRFSQQTLRAKGIIDGAAELLHHTLHLWRASRNSHFLEAALAFRSATRKKVTAHRWWDAQLFKFLEMPEVPTVKQAHRASNGLHLNWVIPMFGEGGGGHWNIFRMIQLLEKRGIQSRIYVMDADPSTPPGRLRSMVHDWYLPIEASVEPLPMNDVAAADVLIATAWQTAWAVRAMGNARVKAYFVQDYEPLFYPTGVESVLAEQTYGFGFKALTSGAWLRSLMQDKYKMDTASFPLAVDHNIYWRDVSDEESLPKSVFAYIRPHTTRRAFELVALALRDVKKQRPEVEIHTAGAHLPEGLLPFESINHGILKEPQLRKLYSRMSVGVAASLTNYSLLPQEMAACGCPVIDLEGENTRRAYPEGAVILAPRTVEGLTDSILKVLDDEAFRKRQSERGLRYAQGLSWEDAADAVGKALRDWASESETSRAGLQSRAS